MSLRAREVEHEAFARMASTCALCRRAIRCGDIVVRLSTIHRWGEVEHAFSHRPGECFPIAKRRSAA